MKKKIWLVVLGAVLTVPFTVFGVSVLSKLRLGAHHPMRGAYLWASQPTATLNTPYNPDEGFDPYKWSYNFMGGTNTVTRLAPGYYQVKFPGMGVRTGSGEQGGHVQVTGYGTAVICNTTGWESYFDAPDVTVNVYCFNLSGAAVDSYFDVMLVF